VLEELAKTTHLDLLGELRSKRDMVTVSINGPMELFTKENGFRIKRMVKELTGMLPVIYTLVSLWRIRPMALASISTRMDLAMKVNGSKMSKKATVKKSGKMEADTSESTLKE